MKLSDTGGLEKLGADTIYKYDGADKALLERFPNPLKKGPGLGSVNITSPEFTSLCPLTGQPDFATIVVEYTPKDWCVESKAWKLYLGSYRNVGEFHESCVRRITNDLIELLDPWELTVRGEFTPRGGISFWPMERYHRPDLSFDFAEIPSALNDRNAFYVGEGPYERLSANEGGECFLQHKGQSIGTARVAEYELGEFEGMARKYAVSNYLVKDKARLRAHLEEENGFEVADDLPVTVVWFTDVCLFNAPEASEATPIRGA